MIIFRNDINLLRFERERHNRKLIKAGIIFSIAACLFLMGVAYYTKAYELKRLDESIRHFSKNRSDISRNLSVWLADLQEQEKNRIRREEEKKKVLRMLASINERIVWSDLLSRVANILPDGAWLTSLYSGRAGDQDSRKEITLVGFAERHEIVAGIISGLEQTGEFYNVSLSYMRLRTQLNRKFFDYEIKVTLYEEAVTEKLF